jgi:long-subunit fatty acid transport protein
VSGDLVKALVATVLLARTAAADPLDDLGFGAAATGTANSRAAAATGADAAHVDPAGVALADRPEVLIGYQYAHEGLQIDGRGAGVDDAHGTSIGLAIPFFLGGLRFGVGTALYLPDQALARLQLIPATEPQFVRFGSAAQRIVLEPVAAVAFGDFAIGAGASLLADAKSNQLTFDVGVVNQMKQGQANLDVALPVRAAPLVGVWWRPSKRVQLAATYRGQLSLDLALDIRANVSVPGVVTGDAIVSIRSASYFTPTKLDLAAAIEPRDDLILTADLAWERWSALASGVPALSVLLMLDISPPLVSSSAPPAEFHDIVTGRVGAEWRAGIWRLRAGGAYLPSPVPAQTGLTSFADGARTLASLGAGVRLPSGGWLTRPIDLDLAIAWQHVMHDLVTKDEVLQPGAAFSSGGDILQAGASATVRF